VVENLIHRVRTSLHDRNEVIKELYNDIDLHKAVIGTLIKKGCSQLDAEDYFTDSIVNFIKSCYRSDFEIRSSLTNYLIGTAKNIWLKQVTHQQKQRTIKEELRQTSEDVAYEINLLSQSKRNLLAQLTGQLDETCRKILALWAANHQMQEIAVAMNYKSPGMARKKKHQCMQRLYSIVAKNPSISNELRALL